MDWKTGLLNLSYASVFLVCVTFLLSAVFSVHLIASVSGIEGITEPVYLEIADYYDNRRAVVTVTADDWDFSTTSYFEDMSTMLTGKHIYYTAAVITGHNPDWNQIQRWLDQGYLEVASHSRNHPRLPYVSYDSEIGGSKLDIIGNLALPTIFSFNGMEYVYSWIEPYGQIDRLVRQSLGEYNYLADRRVSIDDEWATWDPVNRLFDRIGFSIRMENPAKGGVDDATILNSKFDNVYAAGQIYHLMTHPRNVNWEPGQYADVHTSYISNRNDVWYVNFGLLYLYHWIDTQNVIHVTSTGSQDKVFKISISSTYRQSYGAKYPVTYVFDIPPSWADAYVNYRFRETDPWATMETKTPSDFFNGINAVRFDFSNHKAYVSIGFSDVSNEIHLQILPKNQVPVADANGPYTGTEGVAIAFDGSDSSDPDGAIVSYFWDFGDGETSTKQNPSHTYTQDGTYTITLTVTDDDSAIDTDTTAATVTDTGSAANFTASQKKTASTVGFRDTSTSYDEIVSWAWDFGDGQTSTEQNPTHKFPDDGVFDVTLTITDADGSADTITKQVSVLNVAATADFDIVSSQKPTVNEDISFIDQSSDPDGFIVWRFWNFGDGTYSTAQNVTHRYSTVGTFNVNLTVTDDDGQTGTTSKSVTIYDVPPTTGDDHARAMWKWIIGGIVLTIGMTVAGTIFWSNHVKKRKASSTDTA